MPTYARISGDSESSEIRFCEIATFELVNYQGCLFDLGLESLWHDLLAGFSESEQVRISFCNSCFGKKGTSLQR